MKKYFIPATVMAIAIFFSNCHGSKKATSSVPAPALTYEAGIQTIIATDCSPCHFPPKGNKKPLDTYDGAKTNIDEMIRRMELNPGEKGFMPFMHPKLSDSTIAVFKKWRDDGLKDK